MSKRERRFLQSEVSVQSGESPKITGYAAKFGVLSSDLGGFREKLDSACFDKCMNGNPDAAALFNHDQNIILGRTTSGTLRLEVDSVGLKYEIDPPDTQAARDLMTSMKRGDISSSSFGFFCIKDAFTTDRKTGEVIRTVLEASVFDISPVVFPAYPDATSQVRSMFPDDKGTVPVEITDKIAELRSAQYAKEDRVSARHKRSVRSVVSFMTRTPWAILPEKLEAITAFISDRSSGKTVSKDEIQSRMMGYESAAETNSSSSVMVIPVYGVVSQKMNMMQDYSGGVSVELLTKQIRAAIADDSVSTIVLDIDSPGGTVTGVPELAAEILASRDLKPIIGVANGMAASAAYWLLSACSQAVVIPSGEVGSIGVYTTHEDVSAAMDKAGVKITFIKAGANKTQGNPYQAPSADYLADTQAMVDSINVDFTQAVADGRGVSAQVVSDTYGQGRMFLAKDALNLGMVDSIQTLDEVVAGLVEANELSIAKQKLIDSPSVQAANIVKADGENGCTCLCAPCVSGDCSTCTSPNCEYQDGDTAGCDCLVDDDADDDDMPGSTDDDELEILENERIKMLVKVMQMSL